MPTRPPGAAAMAGGRASRQNPIAREVPMSDAAPSNVSRDDFIARARDMIPELRARAREAEDLRRLPDATNAAFHAAGLYRLHQPRRYGGYEMDFHLQIDVAAEIGRRCGSRGPGAAIPGSPFS